MDNQLELSDIFLTSGKVTYNLKSPCGLKHIKTFIYISHDLPSNVRVIRETSHRSHEFDLLDDALPWIHQEFMNADLNEAKYLKFLDFVENKVHTSYTYDWLWSAESLNIFNVTTVHYNRGLVFTTHKQDCGVQLITERDHELYAHYLASKHLFA